MVLQYIMSLGHLLLKQPHIVVIRLQRRGFKTYFQLCHSYSQTSSVYPLSGIWANLAHRALVGFMGTRLRSAKSERSYGFHLVLLGLLPCETAVHAGDTGLDGPRAMAVKAQLMATAGM